MKIESYKNLWSTIVNFRKLKVSDSIVKRSNPMHIVLFSAAALTLLLANACSQEAFSEQTADIEAARTLQKQQDVANIESNIKNSYARLASQHTDICPATTKRGG